MSEKLDKLNNNLEKTDLAELAYILGNKREIFRRNFLAGIGRGIGITVGITIITTILIFVLQKIVKLNLPLIGDYIVDIIEIVEKKRY